jgi:hypothetical protein
MEFRVYDGASRRVGPILIMALAMGMLAAFSTLLLTAQGATRIRNGLFLVLLFPAAIILALSARTMPQSYERLLSIDGQLLGTTNPLVWTIGNQFTLRPAVNLASGQEENQHTEHEVEAYKSDQREDCVSAADHFAIAVPRVKEAVD